MKTLGTVSHLSNKGLIIVRSKNTPAIGLPVFTEDKKRIGRVHNIFGPTKEPYISIKPQLNRKTKKPILIPKVGVPVYIPKKPIKSRGHKKRKKK